MGLSFWQIAIVVLLIVLLFGRGKLSGLMGDLAKGIKSFKQGMQDDDVPSKTPESIGDKSGTTTASNVTKDEAAKG
jgi:sec-independent protein translocase protein TatA